MKFVKLILGIMIFLPFISCTKEVIKPKEVTILEETVSFSTDVVPIFANSKCNDCHSNTGSAKAIINFESSSLADDLNSKGMIDKQNPFESIIYTIAKPGAQHKGTYEYGVDDASKLVTWISQGAKNN